jgi:hypothetical protein
LDERAAWADVRCRAGRLRRTRRRALLASAVVCAALCSTLAAAGQIGSLVAHSKGPHLLVHGTLYGAHGRRAGTVEIELQRATIALGRRVRLMRWRTPRDGRFAARWFLQLDHAAQLQLARGSLVVRRRGGGARTIAVLCAPCRAGQSGQLDLSRAEALALVNDEATFAVAVEHHEPIAGTVALDRSHLRRGVVCESSTRSCTRIYTGRL